MKRVAKLVLLSVLVAMAASRETAASESYCRDICIYSMGYCTAEGGMWVQDCNRTGRYYNAGSDVCNLDSYCWYGAPVY